MLNHIRTDAPTERKLRLFACGCCRASLAEHGRHPGLSDRIALYEALADGTVTSEVLPKPGRYFPEAAVDPMRSRHAFSVACRVLKDIALFRRRPDDVVHAELLRDIFGNPFRPVAFDPAWRTAVAVGLATGMYEGRDFAAMPILADALEDAGWIEWA
jgi:hypothetical protein